MEKNMVMEKLTLYHQVIDIKDNLLITILLDMENNLIPWKIRFTLDSSRMERSMEKDILKN